VARTVSHLATLTNVLLKEEPAVSLVDDFNHVLGEEAQVCLLRLSMVPVFLELIQSHTHWPGYLLQGLGDEVLANEFLEY